MSFQVVSTPHTTSKESSMIDSQLTDTCLYESEFYRDLVTDLLMDQSILSDIDKRQYANLDASVHDSNYDMLSQLLEEQQFADMHAGRSQCNFENDRLDSLGHPERSVPTQLVSIQKAEDTTQNIKEQFPAMHNDDHKVPLPEDSLTSLQEDRRSQSQQKSDLRTALTDASGLFTDLTQRPTLPSTNLKSGQRIHGQDEHLTKSSAMRTNLNNVSAFNHMNAFNDDNTNSLLGLHTSIIDGAQQGLNLPSQQTISFPVQQPLNFPSQQPSNLPTGHRMSITGNTVQKVHTNVSQNNNSAGPQFSSAGGSTILNMSVETTATTHANQSVNSNGDVHGNETTNENGSINRGLSMNMNRGNSAQGLLGSSVIHELANGLNSGLTNGLNSGLFNGMNGDSRASSIISDYEFLKLSMDEDTSKLDALQQQELMDSFQSYSRMINPRHSIFTTTTPSKYLFNHPKMSLTPNDQIRSRSISNLSLSGQLTLLQSQKKDLALCKDSLSLLTQQLKAKAQLSKPTRVSNAPLNNYLKKTKMCFHYFNGVCTRGDLCIFAHSERELRPSPRLYKTKLCIEFIRSGHCPKNGQCRFAHGEEDLRSIDFPTFSNTTSQCDWGNYLSASSDDQQMLLSTSRNGSFSNTSFAHNSLGNHLSTSGLNLLNQSSLLHHSTLKSSSDDLSAPVSSLNVAGTKSIGTGSIGTTSKLLQQKLFQSELSTPNRCMTDSRLGTDSFQSSIERHNSSTLDDYKTTLQDNSCFLNRQSLNTHPANNLFGALTNQANLWNLDDCYQFARLLKEQEELPTLENEAHDSINAQISTSASSSSCLLTPDEGKQSLFKQSNTNNDGPWNFLLMDSSTAHSYENSTYHMNEQDIFQDSVTNNLLSYLD